MTRMHGSPENINMKFQIIDGNGYIVNGVGVPWATTDQAALPQNNENTFLFNPDASEFVPSRSNARESSALLLKAAVHATNKGSLNRNNGSPQLTPAAKGFSVPTFQPMTDVTNIGFTMTTSIPPETQQIYEASAENCSFNPTYHYFPEPPQYFEQEAEYTDQSNFYEGGNENVDNESDSPNENVHHTTDAQSSVPVVPISCTPLYGFIGYSYSVPGSAQSSALLKPTLTSINPDTVPVVSNQLGAVPAIPMQIPAQLPQQHLPQFQTAVPLFSVPTLQQPFQQTHPSTTIPTLPLSQATSTVGGAPKQDSCVTVYVPNIFGDNNRNEKSYPSLIPPTIMPQNQFRWVYPSFGHKA